MLKKSEQKFEPKDGLSDNKEIQEAENDDTKENEPKKDIEPTQSDAKSIDRSKLEKEDQQKLNEIRETLKLEMKKNDGWEVQRGPREEWGQKHKVTTDSPFERLKGWLESFSKTNREAKRLNQELQAKFVEDRTKYSEISFDYKKGVGVEGMVGNKVGILAKGFGECSGLVFQTLDKVAIVHISPNVFRDTFEGGELVRDSDVWSHISFTLREILGEKQEKGAKMSKEKTVLSRDEIAKLQEMVDSGDLKSTMLSGEDSLVPHEIATILGKFAKFNNLPFMKTEIYYVGAIGGGGGYAIYANPEDMYYIGSNGKVMKRGENLPPVMYEYKKKKGK